MTGDHSESFRALVRGFASPGRAVRPKIYLFPPEVEAIDPGELEREIEQIAEAGFGCVNPFDPDLAPTAEQNDLLRSVLRTAQRLGLKVDLTMLRFASLPKIAADSGVDQQEIVYGTAVAGSGTSFDEQIPEPLNAPGRPRTLVAVVGARCLRGFVGAKPLRLDQDSLVDLTDSIVDGQISWTPPEDAGTWLVFGIWSRTAETPWTESPYFDYFSPEGTAAFTGYWDRHVFTEEIQGLVDEVGASLFEDSLHLEGYQLWTARFLAEFKARRGYSLRRFLPVIFIPHMNDWFANTFHAPQTRRPDGPAEFDFPGDSGARIRNDYYQTLSELYEEHHLEVLTRWARTHGLRYRAKVAYHHTLDISSAASVDVPNTETFAMGNSLDGIRAMAGAAHLGGKSQLVVECSPTATQVGQDLYSTTWRQVLSTIHGSFAGGANQVELHAFAYAEGPDAVWSRETESDVPDTIWPGFWPYRGARRPEHRGPLGLGEAYGPRMPYWDHTPDITGFLGREQLVVQHGQPRVDVALYRHSFWSHGFPYLAYHRSEDQLAWFTDKTLEQLGYTYEFVGPALLERQNARVTRGRLDDQGPAYKALVLDVSAQINSVHGIPLATARRILNYVRSGLPVVVVGELPDHTGFYGDAADDAKVRDALAVLLDTPGVRRVSGEEQVADALVELGVEPDFKPARRSNVVSVHRSSHAADLYLLYNQGGVNNMTGAPEPEPESFDELVSVVGRGEPYALDAWTGEVRPIATYERRDDRILTRVRLAPGETAILAIAGDEESGEPGQNRVHATSTTASEIVVGARGELRLRDTAPGSFTTMLDNGEEITSTIADLPAVKLLSSWQLSVEDWQPGPSVTETAKTERSLDLASLAPWPSIPELQDVSGVGHYTADVTLDSSWRRNGNRARLELGPVFDSVRVAVNGHRLAPINCYESSVDVTEHLRDGRNLIEVEVATTLRNRLRTLPEYPEYQAAQRQPYGLVGPVRLVPYGEAVLTSTDEGAG